MRIRDERGANSIEVAIIFPVLLLLVFAVVQAAFFFHGRNVAQIAASACAETARGEQAGTNQEQVARSVLDQAGALSEASVTVSATTTSVTCTVSGRAPLLIPVPRSAIEQSATMPLERVTR